MCPIYFYIVILILLGILTLDFTPRSSMLDWLCWLRWLEEIRKLNPSFSPTLFVAVLMEKNWDARNSVVHGGSVPDATILLKWVLTYSAFIGNVCRAQVLVFSTRWSCSPCGWVKVNFNFALSSFSCWSNSRLEDYICQLCHYSFK